MMRSKCFPFGLVLLLAVAAAVYAPGLRGGFLFDDFVNLDAIGATGPVDDWPTLWRYLSSGAADPTGRPLALASFLLDARDWPAEPAPFLRTNLLLHLLNGLLLACLLRSLSRILGRQGTEANLVALLAAGAWLLHPLLVSTTLYVVQRETMLAALACLAALLAYVHARSSFARDGTGPGLWLAAASILVGTPLAMAGKANGVLLPLLALVLEATVLRRLPAPVSGRGLMVLRWLVLGLPSLLVLAYLCSFLPGWSQPLESRGWSVSQRLLSEPRALLAYLSLWFVPRSLTSGLYNDGFPVSTSLLAPWTTLPCIVGLLAACVLAWRWRASQPAASAAIAFFLGGHLLESSSLPLELYFEHRNYLPAALLFWPFALALAGWRRPRAARVGLGLGVLALLALTTWQRAQLWSQPERMARVWAMQNPDSMRAQATAAMFDTSAGRPELALQRLDPQWRRHPGELQLAFNYVNAACATGTISERDGLRVEYAIANAARGLSLMNRWIAEAIDVAAAGTCTGLDRRRVATWISAMERNPRLRPGADRDQEVQPLLAKLALANGDADDARMHYDRALRAVVTPDNAARQAAELARAGAFEQALAHLDLYESLAGQARRPEFGMARVHAWVLRRQGYWPREMAILRAKLHGEIEARRASGPR
jgi:hypothetical protein